MARQLPLPFLRGQALQGWQRPVLAALFGQLAFSNLMVMNTYGTGSFIIMNVVRDAVVRKQLAGRRLVMDQWQVYALKDRSYRWNSVS